MLSISAHMTRWLLPAGTDPSVARVLLARGLRAFSDGYLSVLLPVYLLSMGLSTFEVGVVATATLLGSAAATIGIGLWGHHVPVNQLKAAALLMIATGVGFAISNSFWPILFVAFLGTLNPSSGDVSVFLPIEHAKLASSAQGQARTALFARYSVIGAVFAAIGALGAALPDSVAKHTELSRHDALRLMFVAYAVIGYSVWWLYRVYDNIKGTSAPPAIEPLDASRRIVVRLAMLFSVDAFAGGLVVNALLSLWLLQRHGLSLAQAGAFFFWSGMLSATSQFLAPYVAQRVGLLNTMVFTHIPASIFLILAAFAPTLPLALVFLLLRSTLSQMDVPTRSAYVMAVVSPEERAAAASLTAVPRSLAAAVSPALAGALFAAGWISVPLVACGVIKIGYDLVLWRACRREVLK
jgi:MFS family permease